MNEKIYETVDSVETLSRAFAVTREAQSKFATYPQEQVDKIFLAAASAASIPACPAPITAISVLCLIFSSLFLKFTILL